MSCVMSTYLYLSVLILSFRSSIAGKVLRKHYFLSAIWLSQEQLLGTESRPRLTIMFEICLY